MTTFHTIKMTKVQIRKRPALFSVPYWNEDPRPPAVEIYRDQHKEYQTWEIGIWTYEYNLKQEVLGLLYFGYPTHFAYYLDNFFEHPHKIEDGFYFDAGTSCPELYVEPKEWERVLQELDVMSRYRSVHPEVQQVS